MLWDNLAKSSRSSRNVLSAALIIIATMAMYNWIVAPHSCCLFAARRYKSIVGKLVEQNKVVSRTIKTKEEKLKQLRKEVKQLEGVFFSPGKANEFFARLQTIAEREGCVVNSLNIIKDKQRSGKQTGLPADISTKAVMLKVVGEYGSIIELLRQLQAYPQKVWLDSIAMEILNNGMIRCEMKITIYTLKSFLSLAPAVTRVQAADNPLGVMSKKPSTTQERYIESQDGKAADNE